MTYENCLESRNQTLNRLFDTTVYGIGELAGDTVGVDGRELNVVLQEMPVCDLQQELDNVIKFEGVEGRERRPIGHGTRLYHSHAGFCLLLFVCLLTIRDAIVDSLGYRTGFYHLH